MKNVSKTNKRIIWLDLIKIIACIMVIILHSIKIGLNDSNYQNGLWIYYLGTFAIPLFFMANGYLMLNKKYSYEQILKKILKISIIVLFWSVLLYLFKFFIRGNEDINNIFAQTFGCFIQKGLFPHFWYLGVLIILYLLQPLLKKIYDSNNFNKYVYSLIILNIILDVVFIYLYKVYNFEFKEHIIQTFRLWIWIMYFMLGGLFNKNNIKLQINIKKLIVISFICVILSIIIESLTSNFLYGNLYAENFYSNVLIIATSFILFLTISKITFKNYNISKISNLTMGIYIIHNIILGILFKIFEVTNNYMCVIILVLTFVISLICSFFISKTPYIKELIKI